jgi:hypothetical protein
VAVRDTYKLDAPTEPWFRVEAGNKSVLLIPTHLIVDMTLLPRE